MIFLSIRGFLDGLLMYHRPNSTSLYKDKADNSLFIQNAINSSYQLNHPLSPSLKQMYSKPFIDTEKGYKSILQNIIFSAQKLNIPFFIHLSSDNHAVGLTCNSEKIKIYDAETMTGDNDLPNEFPQRQFWATKLAYYVFHAFKFNCLGTISGDPLLAINISIYCSSKACSPVISDLLSTADGKYTYYYLDGVLRSKYYINTLFLYIACKNGHAEIVKMLLEKPDINVNQTTRKGMTPLLIATQFGQEIMQLLLNRGAKVNQATSSGVTALLLASRYGHLEIVQLLLDRGANVNAKANDGATPLFMASQQGYLKIVRVLFYKGADINQTLTTERSTPLDIACARGHDEIIKFLLYKKAKKSPVHNELALYDRVTVKSPYIRRSLKYFCTSSTYIGDK